VHFTAFCLGGRFLQDTVYFLLIASSAGDLASKQNYYV